MYCQYGINTISRGKKKFSAGVGQYILSRTKRLGLLYFDATIYSLLHFSVLQFFRNCCFSPPLSPAFSKQSCSTSLCHSSSVKSLPDAITVCAGTCWWTPSRASGTVTLSGPVYYTCLRPDKKLCDAAGSHYKKLTDRPCSVNVHHLFHFEAPKDDEKVLWG